MTLFTAFTHVSCRGGTRGTNCIIFYRNDKMHLLRRCRYSAFLKTTIERSKQIKDRETNLGKEAERLERWTCNAPTSGTVLTASWVCSR